ncbi:MAG: OmpH family outer membrane protein [Acidobacteriota bacterium]
MKTSSTLRRLGVALIGMAALLASPAVFAQETSLKIAVVDLEVVVASSQAGKDLASKLRNLQETASGQVETMQKEAVDLRQRIANGANSLSNDKLAEMQKEYEDKMIAIRRFTDDKQREGQKMQQEGLAAIEKQLEPVFEKVRDEGGYDLILNRVPGVVVMAGESIDITKKVIDTLNTSAQ